MKQGALATPTRTRDCHEFSASNRKRNAIKRDDAVLVTAVKVASLDQMLRHLPPCID